jgi:hypothetical protein
MTIKHSDFPSSRHNDNAMNTQFHFAELSHCIANVMQSQVFWLAVYCLLHTLYALQSIDLQSRNINNKKIIQYMVMLKLS